MKLARLIQFIVQVCVHRIKSRLFLIQLNLQIRSWITTLITKKKPQKNKKQEINRKKVHNVFSKV